MSSNICLKSNGGEMIKNIQAVQTYVILLAVGCDSGRVGINSCILKCRMEC